MNPPVDIDIQRAKGVAIRWPDGRTVFYPVAYLRRMSPSADAKDLRTQLAQNPLTVVPAGGVAPEALTILEAEIRGNYALWLRFSDGHATGLYSWEYLREIEPRTP
ncbi:MAG: hypothetical protein HBSAPP03_22570 [Phycisphaerae bacterium]|nr:MAG: hypothetical protein HBSAPP03_22570 [Phycisphaerae bacterium]